MTLHILNKSPEQRTAFEECLSHSAAEDAILLMEDAVYAGADNTHAASALQGHSGPIYALRPDVTARGIESRLNTKIQLIDYLEFVDLCTEHPHSISWF